MFPRYCTAYLKGDREQGRYKKNLNTEDEFGKTISKCMNSLFKGNLFKAYSAILQETE